MNEGKLVEYIDQGRLFCTLCIQDKGNRLQLLTATNREVSLSSKRTLLVSGSPIIDIQMSRQDLLNRLKAAEKQRGALQKEVDVKELWELTRDEQASFGFKYLAQLWFGEDADEDHISALVRALFEDKLYFKMKDGRFLPNPEERVDQILRQREEEAKREKVLNEGGRWLQAFLLGAPVETPACRQDVVDLLVSLALHGTEAKEFKYGKALLARAGISHFQRARQILVKMGIWEEDENLDLLRLNIKTDFKESLLDDSAQLICVAEDLAGREDLRDLEAFTIDGPMTRDFDDALSVSKEKNSTEIGIHIADVADLISPDSPLDLEARQRASSLYLPRRLIPMLPPSLSQDTFSLKEGCDRPALSLMCRFDPEGHLLDHRLVPSVIRVRHQLTYDQVNGWIGADDLFDEIHRLSAILRRRRIDEGALILSLPEIAISVSADGLVHLRLIEQETPARALVAEWMIFYNQMAANFCRDREIPILYRCQDDPSERLQLDGPDPLFHVFTQRRKLQPLVIDKMPRPHRGLGVDVYTNASSPIRRYLDLVAQRQISHAIRHGEGIYNEEDLEKIRLHTQTVLKDLAKVRQNRIRYWILKYLHQNRDRTYQALVLWPMRRAHRIVLTDFLFMTEVPASGDAPLSPAQRIEVAVEKCNPWQDELVLKLVP